MKIKADFVTNSSSSSFIVLFPDVVTKEMVSKYIKPSWKADRIYDDCIRQLPIKLIQKNIDKVIMFIYEEVKRGHIESIYREIKGPIFYRDTGNYAIERYTTQEEFNKNHLWRSIEYEEEDTRRDYLSMDYTINFLKKNPKGVLYSFSFADDTESGSKLEHGDTFYNLPHIQISHH